MHVVRNFKAIPCSDTNPHCDHIWIHPRYHKVKCDGVKREHPDTQLIIIAPTTQRAGKWCDANGIKVEDTVILDTINPLYITMQRLAKLDTGYAYFVDTQGYDFDKVTPLLEAIENHPGNIEIETVFF